MSLDTCTKFNFVCMGKLCIAILSSYILSYVYVAKLCLLYITHAIYVHTYLYIHGLCGVCEQMISSLWIWVGLLEPLHTQLVTVHTATHCTTIRQAETRQTQHICICVHTTIHVCIIIHTYMCAYQIANYVSICNF